MIGFYRIALFALLASCETAAPIISSSGLVSIYRRCGGDCDSYTLLGEEAGTGPAYDLSITRGDRVQTATATLTAALGPVFGSVLGTAHGSCRYNGADEICFIAMSKFDGLIEGTFVITGGSGKALLRPGDIQRSGTVAPPGCELTVNGTTAGCQDSFEVTFDVPFELKVRFFDDLSDEGDFAEQFEYAYRLDHARHMDTGVNYAMRSVSDTAIPEPSTLLLMTSGLGLAAMRWLVGRRTK